MVVDTHVHKTAKRIGLVTSSTNPESTRRALESMYEPAQWSEMTVLLIGLGQSVCGPKPDCAKCPLGPLIGGEALCDSASSFMATKKAQVAAKGQKRKAGDVSW